LSSSSSQQEETKEDDNGIIVIFFTTKKMQKIRRRRRELTFKLPLPTTLKLLLLSHSCYHHIEAPLVGALLKLPALEAPVNFAFLKL
jgi:hypothetical protein